jgi:hypothetical protein
MQYVFATAHDEKGRPIGQREYDYANNNNLKQGAIFQCLSQPVKRPEPRLCVNSASVCCRFDTLPGGG